MRACEFVLAGTGICLPETRLASSEIDARLNRPDGWLEANCGVRTRYVCTVETQEELAAGAARAAIAAAGLDAGAIDLVISAAAVPKQPIPALAPLIARAIGIEPGCCTAFDVNSTCLSFLTATDVAMNLLQTGRFRAALVVSAEIASRALPWATDPATAGLFGDGAAAAVLMPRGGPGCPARLVASRFETYHQGYDFCQLPAGGTGIDFHREPERFHDNAYFQMDGHSLFKLTAHLFPAFVERVLADARWQLEDVDLVIPHQASPLALAHLVKRCGFARDKVVDIVASHGNQVAASIPTALHEARIAGRLPARARVLFLGTSAGVSFGGMAVEYQG